jgi:creatinine amidohydrolase
MRVTQPMAAGRITSGGVDVIHAHGGPNHNRALDQAGDYFRDTYGGHMVHLMGGLPPPPEGAEDPLSTNEKRENGFEVHAGALETSEILFLRPELVASGVNQAPAQAGATWEDLIRLARAPDWPVTWARRGWPPPLEAHW